jgi:hypothetical protein
MFGSAPLEAQSLALPGHAPKALWNRPSRGSPQGGVPRLPRWQLCCPIAAATAILWLTGMSRRQRRVIRAGRASGSKERRLGRRDRPGPPGASSSAVRDIRSNCDATNCVTQCNDDEVLHMAYCRPANAATFPTERSASCRNRNGENNPLVTACIKIASP